MLEAQAPVLLLELARDLLELLRQVAADAEDAQLGNRQRRHQLAAVMLGEPGAVGTHPPEPVVRLRPFDVRDEERQGDGSDQEEHERVDKEQDADQRQGLQGRDARNERGLQEGGHPARGRGSRPFDGLPDAGGLEKREGLRGRLAQDRYREVGVHAFFHPAHEQGGQVAAQRLAQRDQEAEPQPEQQGVATGLFVPQGGRRAVDQAARRERQSGGKGAADQHQCGKGGRQPPVSAPEVARRPAQAGDDIGARGAAGLAAVVLARRLRGCGCPPDSLARDMPGDCSINVDSARLPLRAPPLSPRALRVYSAHGVDAAAPADPHSRGIGAAGVRVDPHACGLSRGAPRWPGF